MRRPAGARGLLRWVGLALAVGTAAPARAQFTETAFTAPPGRWLVECDLLGHGVERTPDLTYSYWSVGYVQLTRGVTATHDWQLAVQPWVREELRWRGELGEAWRGEAAVRLYARTKWRIWSAPDESWAVAVLPYVSAPVEEEAGHQFVDLGLILPVSRQLSPRVWLEAQLAADGLKAADQRREWWWLVSANLQYTLNDKWGVYTEAIGDLGSDSWRTAAWSAGVGVTRAWRGGWSGDVGVYRGLSADALDWEFALRLIYQL